jgi:hypothetical protein
LYDALKTTQFGGSFSIKMFAKIKAAFENRRLKKEALAAFEGLLLSVVSDGVITDEEMTQISRFYHDNNLTTEEYCAIRDTVFNQVVARYTADRRVTDAEQDSVLQIGRRLDLSLSALEEVKSHMTYYHLLNTIETCAFHDLPATQASGVMLKPGEIDYFDFSSSLLEERVINRQYVGGSHGVSFRLMRGVSYRVGQSRGHLVSQTGIVPISDGKFVVTNKRLIFSGDKKSVNAPLDKLLDVEFYKDGVRFALTNRQKPVMVQFYTEQSAELAAMYVSRVLNQ